MTKTTAEIGEIWLRDGIYSELILSEDEIKKYRNESRIMFKEKPNSPYDRPSNDSDIFKELMKHPRVIELVEICMVAELKEKCKVDSIQDWMYMKPPGELGRDIHQNIFYTHANRGEIINTSIALDDADKGNGGLFIYPNSQHESCLPITIDEDRQKTNPDDWRNERGKPCVMPGNWIDGEWVDKYEKVYTNARAGSVSLIHSNIIHGSEENKSEDRWRTAYLNAYIKQGAVFSEGGHMNRKRINVYD